MNRRERVSGVRFIQKGGETYSFQLFELAAQSSVETILDPPDQSLNGALCSRMTLQFMLEIIAASPARMLEDYSAKISGQCRMTLGTPNTKNTRKPSASLKESRRANENLDTLSTSNRYLFLPNISSSRLLKSTSRTFQGEIARPGSIGIL